MNTKDLIAALERQDPSGELEVISGDGRPIHFVERQPAYYDGRLHVPVQDPGISTYYNIVGWRVTRSGEKVRLQLVGLEDALEANPELPVEIEGGDSGFSEWLERARERNRRP